MKLTGWSYEQIQATPALVLDHLLWMDEIAQRVQKALTEKEAKDAERKSRWRRNR